MQPPAWPVDESQRLQTLQDYGILDTEGEQAFDDLTALATELCGVPIALISLVDADRQWFKSRIGLEDCETPRSVSFCGHAILNDGVFVVEDAHQDPRFSGNPLVTGGPHIRFYAGAPLTSPSGYRIGTLCVLDHEPRQLDADQLSNLEALARQAVALLELRRKSAQLERRDERRSHLFSVVSHDLRTEFTGLLGYIGMLADDLDDGVPDPVRVHATRARARARDALRVGEELLAWARAELGSLQFRLARCVEMLRPLADEKEITLVEDYDEALRLCADDTLLTSMIRNLLANAIKFSPAGEPVELTSRREKDQVVITIQDRGQGMGRDQIEALERGDVLETTLGTAGERGTGLGLLTTRQFAQRHGGSLRLITDGGTRAVLRLPIVAC